MLKSINKGVEKYMCFLFPNSCVPELLLYIRYR
jgi:hypothetical protein